MTDGEIDKILEEATRQTPVVEPAVLRKVAEAIQSTMQPVKPLPPAWVLAGGMALICLAVALVGAMRAGFSGIAKFGTVERVVIFSMLAALLCSAAVTFVREMIPGSWRGISSTGVLAVVCLALAGVFCLLFRDYRTEHFLAAGILCLGAGVAHAVPAGLLSWWLLRRGFAVNFVAAGLAGGTLAGLAGVTLLELHCANLEAFHVLIWHTAVVPVSGMLGAAVAWGVQRWK